MTTTPRHLCIILRTTRREQKACHKSTRSSAWFSIQYPSSRSPLPPHFVQRHREYLKPPRLLCSTSVLKPPSSYQVKNCVVHQTDEAGHRELSTLLRLEVPVCGAQPHRRQVGEVRTPQDLQGAPTSHYIELSHTLQIIVITQQQDRYCGRVERKGFANIVRCQLVGRP